MTIIIERIVKDIIEINESDYNRIMSDATLSDDEKVEYLHELGDYAGDATILFGEDPEIISISRSEI